MTQSTPDEDLSARLARLETGFGEMRQVVTEIGGAVKSLSAEFQASRRPQWQLLATFIGLLFTAIMMASAVLALAGRASISPIITTQASMHEILERHDRRIEGLMSLTHPLEARFTEIETQFRTLSHLSNKDYAEHERFLRMIWKKAFAEDLPSNGERPVIGRQ